MIDRIRQIFATTMEDREPLHMFTIPEIDGSFGVLGSPLAFWSQIAVTLLIQASVSCIFGSIIYVTIVKQRNTPMASIIGYGVVIPLVTFLPFYLIRLLAIRNMCTMVTLGSIPMVLVLRCLEALHGTTPTFIERDIQTYCGYYAAIVPFQYDPKSGRAIKSTVKDLLAMGARLVIITFLTILAYSVMIPYDYAPFPIPSSQRTSFGDFFHWGRLLNNLLVAGLTSLSIEGGTLGVGFGISLISGYATIRVMDNPILCSKSPSDFWSLRWNKIVHQLLKRGIYLPCLKCGQRYVAATLTFLASGILHEYVLSVIALKGKLYADQHYVPRHGAHLLFFSWNGFVMIAEHVLSEIVLVKRFEGLPRPLLTFLTLMTVLPVSHLFTDEYVTSGFFSDYSVGYPILVHLPQAK